MTKQRLERLRLIARLRKAGIKIPIIAIDEAKKTGLPLAVLCAVLEQETGGGRNVFGHDRDAFGRVIWHGRTGNFAVTKRRYLAYKRFRDATGARPPYGRMQGVGPMQLTWYTFQDAADRLGGAWLPRYNVRVGAGLLAEKVKRVGLRRALAQYNGSEKYASEVMARLPKWEKVVAGPARWKLVGPVRAGGVSLLAQDLTHATSGIPLYPALDDAFARPGTSMPYVVAPENMVVTKQSSSYPGDAFYATGVSGIRYWFGHLVKAPATGKKFTKGQVFGRVLDHTVGGGPHVHVGVNVENLVGKGRQLVHHTNYTHGAPKVGVQLERLT